MGHYAAQHVDSPAAGWQTVLMDHPDTWLELTGYHSEIDPCHLREGSNRVEQSVT